MKIALDARALSGRLTGDRTYWRGLITGLSQIDTENQYSLFLRLPLSDDDQLCLPANFTFIVVPSANERVWSLVAFGRALNEHNIEIAHMQYTVPPNLSCRTVTTVHDITFRLFPRLFSFKDRFLLNLSVPSSMRRADAVLTVSENSRNDILNNYPFVPSTKVVATLLAVGPEFKPLDSAQQIEARKRINAAYGLEGEYALSVGVLQPRKNLPILIDAFVRAKDKAGIPLTLAIAGKIGWLSADTEAAILKAGNAVKMLGYVADNDLPLLYGCASFMAHPALYEGFGLPALEAMASGCPVIAGNNSSLPEVVGDAGLLIPADSSACWEESLVLLAENDALRSKMRSKGLTQASKFSWTETARITLDVYRSVVTK